MIKNKDKLVSARLTTSDYECLRKMALRDDKRISKYLRKIIKKVIKEQEEKENENLQN